MKLKNVTYYGFTRRELEGIFRLEEKDEKALPFNFSEQVRKALACDVMFTIQPNGDVGLVKMEN